jgi:hypothetical protein
MTGLVHKLHSEWHAGMRIQADQVDDRIFLITNNGDRGELIKKRPIPMIITIEQSQFHRLCKRNIK